MGSVVPEKPCGATRYRLLSTATASMVCVTFREFGERYERSSSQDIGVTQLMGQEHMKVAAAVP